MRFPKKLLCLTIAGALLLTPRTVFAKPSEEQKLENESDKLNEDIASIDEDLVETEAQIEFLESEIEANEQELSDAEEDLSAAETQEEILRRYVRLRMKYQYEFGTESLLSVFLDSRDIADFLNRIYYEEKLSDYEDEKLETLVCLQQDVTDLRTTLLEEQDELSAKRKKLKASKKKLKTMLSKKEKQLNATYKKLAAERAKELEAERQKELAENVTGITYQDRPSSQTDALEVVPDAKDESDDSYYLSEASGDHIIGDYYSTDGESVVEYAKQFVGNRYVWGGNSLTEGCDCSGFVVQVYKHFGIDLSRTRSSRLLRNVGRPVDLADIQLGDIVCYNGHVALYSGNSAIVEAQSSRTGITNGRSVTHAKIITIRRVL